MSQWNISAAPNKWPDVFLLLSLEEDLVSKVLFTTFPSMSLGWAVGPKHLRPVGLCWAGNQPFWTGFLNLIQMSPGYHLAFFFSPYIGLTATSLMLCRDSRPKACVVPFSTRWRQPPPASPGPSLRAEQHLLTPWCSPFSSRSQLWLETCQGVAEDRAW